MFILLCYFINVLLLIINIWIDNSNCYLPSIYWLQNTLVTLKIFLFSAHNNVRCSFYQWGDLDLKNLSHMPKVKGREVEQIGFINVSLALSWVTITGYLQQNLWDAYHKAHLKICAFQSMRIYKDSKNLWNRPW